MQAASGKSSVQLYRDCLRLVRHVAHDVCFIPYMYIGRSQLTYIRGQNAVAQSCGAQANGADRVHQARQGDGPGQG